MVADCVLTNSSHRKDSEGSVWAGECKEAGENAFFH